MLAFGRLFSFFQLLGLVTVDQNAVSITFRPFNDKQLNQDLTLLCERVKKASPRLPDGRQFLFTKEDSSHSNISTNNE
jgi:hypothetical protein